MEGIYIMKFPKQSEAIFSILNDTIEQSGYGCELRKMFGHKTFFVNGYMFAGVFGETGIHLRVGQSMRDDAIENTRGVAYFEANGRIMKDHLLLTEEIYSDEEKLTTWLEKAHDHTLSQPPKKKK
ncbi:MAG: hypothetical protein GF372_07890 [Candidatus Marinimicrobia bacterium]|nr:hypothetical protein [Candidatus Neomarinimicrobiota bacterium]